MSSNTVRNPFIKEEAGGQYGMYPSPATAIPISEISTASNVQMPQPSTQFCERKCNKYFWGCCCSTIGLLILAFIVGIFLPGFGLIIAAFVPGVMILSFVQNYYKEQITIGQMTVSFLEAILWMIPLLIWDLIWILVVQSNLGDSGLCSTCILGYFLNAYFVAGFCEELLKYKVISRLKNSLLTPDYRCLMVYGVCAGAGFATVENLLYVLSSDFGTAIVRAFTAVPLHCLTGCLIGLGLSRQKCLGISTSFGRVMLVPWFLHGTYDFVLTIGANSPQFAPASPVIWILVYVTGLVYARREAMEFYKASPVTSNIHQAILQDDPPILGQQRIAQWGAGTDCVCECFLLCACCCVSRRQTEVAMQHTHTQTNPAYARETPSGYAV
eukprot:gene6772-13721_t